VSAGDDSVIDDLVAVDMVNHAAGPAAQGRDGWKRIVQTIRNDLGSDSPIETHHLFADGTLVAHHMTIHGRHHASTMPLLSGLTANGADLDWTYIHIWRVVEGQVVEHWACRDDVGFLRQAGGLDQR
jgi:predicted ester cyclase